MILVMSVVLIVSVMAAGMIGSAAVKAHIGPDQADRMKALALADSGIDIAAYYLESPMLAPSMGPGGYWTGVSNMSLGDGTLDITVTLVDINTYQVVSRGRINRGSVVIRQSSIATMKVIPKFAVLHAVTFNAPSCLITSTVTIEGSTQASGILTNRGYLKGDIKALDLFNFGLIEPGYTYTQGPNSSTTPTAANLRDYSTYVYDGATYSAKVITTTTAGATLGPTSDNPLGIFKCAGNLTLQPGVTINGTLQVEGILNINGSANITSQKNQPALIVKGDVIMRNLTPKMLAVNGLAWMGGSLKTAVGATGNMNFHGALLFGGAGSVDSLYTGAIEVHQEPSTIGQVNLSTASPTPSVTLLQYSNRKDPS